MDNKTFYALVIFILLFFSFYTSLKISHHETNQEKIEQAANRNYWVPYMKNLEKDIKSNWTPPRQKESASVVVMFLIEKDGGFKNLKIVKHSKSPEINKAALEAIQKTAPFKPFPKEFKGESVPIEFSFDYNVVDLQKRN